jgi:phenol 2-monooxygenase
MNTSLQDGYNIGWKLAMVLKNQASPSLLKTYNLEREKVAADLISFDRDFAKLFSSSKAGSELNAVSQAFSEAFIKSAQYMAGLTARYAESPITNYKGAQDAAAAIEVGKRFPTAQVVRFADAKAIQLVTALPADGRWRIVAFLGDIREPAAADRMKKVRSFPSLPPALQNIPSHFISIT